MQNAPFCIYFLPSLCYHLSLKNSFRNRENLQYKTNSRFGFIESVHENYWKVQQFSRPLAPAEAVFCFPSEPSIPEGPEYEKISTLYRCAERSFTNSARLNDSCCDFILTILNGRLRQVLLCLLHSIYKSCPVFDSNIFTFENRAMLFDETLIEFMDTDMVFKRANLKNIFISPYPTLFFQYGSVCRKIIFLTF